MGRRSKITSKAKALKVAKIASEKKAKKVVVLDMRKISNICDYFVVMSCESEHKSKAISEVIEEELLKINVRPHSIGGREGSGWVVVDYLDIIVHIFYEPLREFYNLERLWRDAPQLNLSKPRKKVKPKRKIKKRKTRSTSKRKSKH